MKTGLYSITNTLTGDSYVGASVDIPRRICSHKSHFKLGKHPNRHLQDHADKYGIDKFEFKTLLFCDKVNLTMYEDIFIKSGLFTYNVVLSSDQPLLFNPEIRANHLKATTSAGFRRIRSDDMRRRLSTEGGAKQLKEAQEKANRPESREKIGATHRAISQTTFRKAHLESICGIGGEANARKNGKPVRCIEIGETFPSIRAAARHLIDKGVTNNRSAFAGIQAAVTGKCQQAYGFHWEFVSKHPLCDTTNIFTEKT